MFLQNLISKKLGLVKKALSVKVKVNLALQKFGQNLPQQENDPSDLSKTDDKSGNIGEWSELGALAYICRYGGLYGADFQQQKNNKFYKVSEISFEGKNKEEDIIYKLRDNKIEIVTSETKKIIRPNELEILLPLFFEKLSYLAKHPKEKNTPGGFTLEEGEKIRSLLNKQKIKSPSQNKNDIYLRLIDQKQVESPKYGYSIKSRIAAADSLINASKTTNFIFEIVDKKNKSSNELLDIIKRQEGEESFEPKETVSKLKELGYEFKLDPEKLKETFRYNLTIIDSKLPFYLGDLIVENYSSKGTYSLEDLMKSHNFNIKEKNKIKEYLIKSAFGMFPRKKWDGVLSTKSFILVNKEGDVFILSNNQEDYIIKNYKFETGSTTRTQCGKVYEEKGKFFIKLNLAVRYDSKFSKNT